MTPVYCVLSVCAACGLLTASGLCED